MILLDNDTVKSSSAISLIRKATATIVFLILVGILASTTKVKRISANFGLLYCIPKKIYPLALIHLHASLGSVIRLVAVRTAIDSERKSSGAWEEAGACSWLDQLVA